MSRTVIVNLDDLNSLLTASIDRAVKNGGHYVGVGRIVNDAVARVGHGLAQMGCLQGQEGEQ